MMKYRSWIWWLAVVGLGCGVHASSSEGLPLFTELPALKTGISFENRLTPTRAFNVFTYRNYYNGGGVGIGDVNGDGLPDLYLTANQLPNRLYLNRGDFQFEDITEAAGVAGTKAWSTGVALADVNGDGWLDIYVCNGGDVRGDNTANELFINQGPDAQGLPHFVEMAEAYNVADKGQSTHAAFFDYDRDGDLDLYVLNNSSRSVDSFGLRNIRTTRNPVGGHKLYRNDSGRFTDVSATAGIYGSEIGFGLGVTVGDINLDGWPDLYISNDFFERDYLYLNNQDGTFREILETAMPVISMSSMGADLADINNDGWPDLFSTDMLPEDDVRLKTTSTFETWDLYQAKLRQDYHHQLMRNMLHRNNGDGTFTEVGQMAGVSATDWSWGALLVDLDLDGYKDLFICNGVGKDVTDQDFIHFFSSEEAVRKWVNNPDRNFLELIDKIPSQPLPNYAYHNQGDGTFTNKARAWGLEGPGYSNGAAYGDLDGDGDLDLIVNNLDAPVSVYRNEAVQQTGHRWLQVQLIGDGQNPFGLGAKVTVQHAGQTRYLEQYPMRGFQSSIDYGLTFGLGQADTVAAVQVVWPDGRMQALTNVPANQRLRLEQKNATAPGTAGDPAHEAATPLFADATEASGLTFAHRENRFVDFDREALLWKMTSTEGPALAVGDVNGDGQDDVFIGGARDQAGALFTGQADGRFRPTTPAPWEADRAAEDVDAVCFDADGDGDLDLYVASGGSEGRAGDAMLQDRLYRNDGRGTFTKIPEALPFLTFSKGAVAAGDYDGDGDLDLFVGGRVVPGQYGMPPPSVLLQNDGTGRYHDVTTQAAPALDQMGLVTDAAWTDYDGDGYPDLLVVGEWMPVRLFRNTGGTLVPQEVPALAHTDGLWNRLLVDDLDGDGDDDYVLGNLGVNNKIFTAPDKPATLLVGDFDQNGSIEQVLAYFKGEASYPLPLRGEIIKQLTFLRRRFSDFRSYAGASIEEVFTDEERAAARTLYARTRQSVVVENQGAGQFQVQPLPAEAQLSPVYGLLAGDFDGDGHRDLLLGGNFYNYRVIIGRMEASYGLLLRGDGRLGFTAVPSRESGFRLSGQVRRLAAVNTSAGQLVVAARNDAPAVVVRARNASAPPPSAP
jgi:hypothetical protein